MGQNNPGLHTVIIAASGIVQIFFAEFQCAGMDHFNAVYSLSAYTATDMAVEKNTESVDINYTCYLFYCGRLGVSKLAS
jgi:hypothetical protein